MDHLLANCIAQIQSIIDQLYADLDAISDGADTAAIREAIQQMEAILHHYENQDIK